MILIEGSTLCYSTLDEAWDNLEADANVTGPELFSEGTMVDIVDRNVEDIVSAAIEVITTMLEHECGVVKSAIS